MKIRKLRKKLRKQARAGLRDGSMSQMEYDTTMAMAGSRDAIYELNARIEADVNPWNQQGVLMGMDWSTFFANIWNWFVENWPKILEIIITIAPLLLLQEQQRHENS